MKQINFTIKEKEGAQPYTLTYISRAGMFRTRSFETLDETLQNQSKLHGMGINAVLQINYSNVIINP